MDPATLIGIGARDRRPPRHDDPRGLQPHGDRPAARRCSWSSAARSARPSPASAMADVKKIGGWFKLALMPAKVPPVSRPHRHPGQPRREGPQGGPAGPGGPGQGHRRPVPQARPADGHRRHRPRGAARRPRGRDRRQEGARTRSPPSSSPPWAATRRPIGIIGTVIGLIHVLENLVRPGVARPADRRRVRRHPLGRALGQPLLAAHGRQDHPHQRPAGRPDGAARRGHHRDPGRHQPARRPPEADLPRAAQ